MDAFPSIILNSPVMEALLGLVLGGTDTEEGVFSDFETDTGLEVDSIEYAEMFLDVDTVLSIGLGGEEQGEVDAPEMGVVLRGDFDVAGLVANMERAMEDAPGGSYEVENYRGYDIYVDSSGDPDNLAFAIPDPGTFLFGTTGSLRSMLDVAAGVAPAASGEGAQVLEALGPRHFGLVMRLPPEAMEMATAGDDGDMSLIGSLAPGALTASITVMSLLVQDDTLLIQSRQLFDEESAAAASKEFNEGTMLMLGAMSGSPELQQLVSGIEVSREGRTVSYDMTLDEPSIMAVIDFLLLFMQMGEGTQN